MNMLQWLGGDLLILIVPVIQKTIPVKGDNLAALFDDWRPGEAALLDIVLNVMVYPGEFSSLVLFLVLFWSGKNLEKSGKFFARL